MKSMNPSVEEKIRTLKLPQLKLLALLVKGNHSVFTTKQIIDLIHTDPHTFGSIITPLLRHKVDGKSLVIKAGEDMEQGTRWQVNNKLVSKSDLVLLLDDMEVHIEIKAHK